MSILIWSILKEHRKIQNLLKSEAKEFYNDQNYVFTNAGGRYFHPDSPRQGIKRLLKAAGLSHTTIHSLRHSYASILFELGEDHKVIQSILGHASFKTTMDIYVHLKDQQKKSAADKMDQLLFLEQTKKKKQA